MWPSTKPRIHQDRDEHAPIKKSDTQRLGEPLDPTPSSGAVPAPGVEVLFPGDVGHDPGEDAPVPANPNAAAFSGVSGASIHIPCAAQPWTASAGDADTSAPAL